MFIYSNHYSILSKLLNEDYKTFFVKEKKSYKKLFTCLLNLNNKLSAVDETEYYLHDFIDVNIYEFESYNFVDVELESNENEKTYSLKQCFDETRDNLIIFEKESLYEDGFIKDHIQQSNGLTFYDYKVLGVESKDLFFNHNFISAAKFKNTEHLKTKFWQWLKYSQTEMELFDYRLYANNFKVLNPFYVNDEFIETNLFPNNQNYFYFLNDNHDFVKNNNELDWPGFPSFLLCKKYEEEEVKVEKWVTGCMPKYWTTTEEAHEGTLNHIWMSNLVLERPCTEYWFEPIFAFSNCRDLYVLRVEHTGIFEDSFMCGQSDMYYDSRASDIANETFQTC